MTNFGTRFGADRRECYRDEMLRRAMWRKRKNLTALEDGTDFQVRLEINR